MITLKESQSIWINDYNERYLAYNPKLETQLDLAGDFIKRRTSLAGGNGTLIDVACGLGFESLALSRWYTVTGIDNSEVAIDKASTLLPYGQGRLSFICDDVKNITTQYDIVFLKGPEFFSGYPIEHKVFKDYLDYTIKLALKKYILILHTSPPFDRWVSTNPKQDRTSYMQDPEKLTKLFSQYGPCTSVHENRKIVIEVLL